MPVVVNGPPRASEWHTLVLPNARRWGPWHVETPPLNGGKRSRSHARPPDVEACGGEERRAEAPSSSCFSIPRTRLLPSSGLFHTYLPTSFFCSHAQTLSLFWRWGRWCPVWGARRCWATRSRRRRSVRPQRRPRRRRRGVAPRKFSSVGRIAGPRRRGPAACRRPFPAPCAPGW